MFAFATGRMGGQSADGFVAQFPATDVVEFNIFEETNPSGRADLDVRSRQFRRIRHPRTEDTHGYRCPRRGCRRGVHCHAAAPAEGASPVGEEAGGHRGRVISILEKRPRRCEHISCCIYLWLDWMDGLDYSPTEIQNNHRRGVSRFWEKHRIGSRFQGSNCFHLE